LNIDLTVSDNRIVDVDDRPCGIRCSFNLPIIWQGRRGSTAIHNSPSAPGEKTS